MNQESATPLRVRKGEPVQVRITHLAPNGAGEGAVGTAVVRVARTAPGDVALALPFKKKKRIFDARLLELQEASPMRIAPRCPLFGRCGGCAWQHLRYEDQLLAKDALVRGRLAAHAPDAVFSPIVPSPDPWRYRNKMEFCFGADDDGRLVGGLHPPGAWWRTLDVPQCFLTPQPAEALLRTVVEYGRARGLDAWNPRTHEGCLRHLLYRWSAHHNRFLAVLFTGDEGLPEVEVLLTALRKACPELVGFQWYVNDDHADAVKFNREMFRWGDDYLEEELDGLRFRISPESFFQANPKGAALLYALVRDYLALDGTQTLLDAFCGAGTIGQYCARDAARVIGVELLEQAVDDARAGAERNGLVNCEFHAGEARVLLPRLAQEGYRFERIVVDPPRCGLDRKSRKALCALAAPLLVYVSCNLTALLGDLEVLAGAGYRVTRARAVDLFPHTPHVETVLCLQRDADALPHGAPDSTIVA